jgi:hypothetical protein
MEACRRRCDSPFFLGKDRLIAFTVYRGACVAVLAFYVWRQGWFSDPVEDFFYIAIVVKSDRPRTVVMPFL